MYSWPPSMQYDWLPRSLHTTGMSQQVEEKLERSAGSDAFEAIEAIEAFDGFDAFEGGNGREGKVGLSSKGLDS